MSKQIISIKKDGLFLLYWANGKEPEIHKIYSVYYGNDTISKQYYTIGEACQDAFAFKNYVNGRWYGLIFRKRYDKSMMLFI